MKKYLISMLSVATAMLMGIHPTQAMDAAGAVDALFFGNDASEQAHHLTTDHSDTVTGLLDQPARRLLALDAENWQGGTVALTMKVDPAKVTYFTIRLSGSDLNTNRLILFCEGKQIGYRHLGDVDILDSPNGAPGFGGRFFYSTNPLPQEMTRGKTELHFEIRSSGEIWGYGTKWEQYQKPFKEATRGIYGVYTHTDGFFVPPSDEVQGPAMTSPPTRGSPGPEVIAAAQARCEKQVRDYLGSPKPLNQLELWFLARAYAAKVPPTQTSLDLVRKAVEALDQLYVGFRADPKLAQSEPSTYNPDWYGLGSAAQSVVLLAEPLKPFFDQEVSGAPGVVRRAGWTEMFVACRDGHRESRRSYTNQSMIVDTYGIYLPNRAVAVLDPKRALPEKRALRYLHESAGLEPWLGSERDGVPLKPLSESYLELTDKGLTKELGFVGYYGEVLDWMTGMYDATRPTPGQPGDARLLAQLVKAAKARAVFRHPALDNDGNRAMRAEAVVGWRDQEHYPGDVTYQERPTWDATAITSAAAALDPTLVGYAQQMFADNQFYASIAEQMKGTGLRTTAGLLFVAEDERRLRAQPPRAARLPMSPGQPDFAWADEEDCVLAVKHGDEILYVSLYWRARNAINFLARVHYITPRVDRIAVVRQEEQFEPSGELYARPDWVNMGFGNGGLRYPGDLHSALAGEKLPVAKVPEGMKFNVGDENPFAGRASFYQLRYGPYLIGMNTTANQTFDLAVPAGVATVPELVTGKTMKLGGGVKVGPRSTVVLYLAPKN